MALVVNKACGLGCAGRAARVGKTRTDLKGSCAAVRSKRCLASILTTTSTRLDYDQRARFVGVLFSTRSPEVIPVALDREIEARGGDTRDVIATGA